MVEAFWEDIPHAVLQALWGKHAHTVSNEDGDRTAWLGLEFVMGGEGGHYVSLFTSNWTLTSILSGDDKHSCAGWKYWVWTLEQTTAPMATPHSPPVTRVTG